MKSITSYRKFRKKHSKHNLFRNKNFMLKKAKKKKRKKERGNFYLPYFYEVINTYFYN